MPLPSPPLLYAIGIPDSFLGIWHLKNLFWLGGMWKDWNWLFQQQLWSLLVTQGKVQRWLDSLDANPHKLMALLCCHTSRGKSPPSVGMAAPVPGRALGGEQWTGNTLGHGKGLTYLDAWPHISFTLSFSKEKEMEGKPLGGLLPYLPWGRWWWSSPGGCTWANRSQFSCPAT